MPPNKQPLLAILLIEEERDDPLEDFLVIVLPLQHFKRESDLLVSSPSPQLFDALSFFSGLSGLARSSKHLIFEKDVKDWDFP